MTDPWRAEQDRQTKELADIIDAAIHAHAGRLIAEGRQPMINAVASALVISEGSMLAGIEDPRHRKALRRSMEKMLPEVIAKAKVKNYATVVVAEGKRQ